MPRANRHVLLDSEDPRLTAPERNYLRSLVLRLHAGEAAQPVVNSAEFEAEMARVFGELERRPR